MCALVVAVTRAIHLNCVWVWVECNECMRERVREREKQLRLIRKGLSSAYNTESCAVV